MNKPLHHFFTTDHHRIDSLLNKACEEHGTINADYYNQFREGLLRHIKMEEKIFFPAAKKIDPALMDELIPKYRLEHGALTALMVPPPDASLIKVIRYLLEKHDAAEEDPGGMYDVCEALTHEQTDDLLEQLSKVEKVPLHPPNPAPIAMESARRALLRAGYDYDEILQLNSAF